ncbi:MAG: hypothetical protein MZV65_46635 [Chromatiales bacterium]|nr:hypothetical protein [Chromatiales bacterium]
MNLFVVTTASQALPAGVGIKNVEIFNINSDGTGTVRTDADFLVAPQTARVPLNASKLVGATQIWQADAAENVSKVAATQTVGFRGDFSPAVGVQYETATGNLALDGVAVASTVTVSTASLLRLN